MLLPLHPFFILFYPYKLGTMVVVTKAKLTKQTEGYASDAMQCIGYERCSTLLHSVQRVRVGFWSRMQTRSGVFTRSSSARYMLVCLPVCLSVGIANFYELFGLSEIIKVEIKAKQLF